jgi:acyl-CoA reductase-like NAD-dependent aldehyde dehydrogenase
MSVHTVERRQDGAAHDVRWRSPVDGANCSRRFIDGGAAASFDAAMKARLALDRAQAAWAVVPERWREAVAEELASP